MGFQLSIVVPGKRLLSRLVIACAILNFGSIISAQDIKLEWSHPDVETSPVKAVAFHGPFCNDVVTVTGGKLPAHDFVELSMDLLILRAWDGSVPVPAKTDPPPIGPDFIRVAVVGGPNLLFATFSNMPSDPPGFRREAMLQSYPSPLPGRTFPMQTGAKEKNTLGYFFADRGPPVPVPMDATYALKFIVPHREDQIAFQISGLHLQNARDESWGVSNVRLTPLGAAQIEKPDENAIADAFKAALSGPPDKMPEAFQTLIRGMDATTDWIDKNVNPMPLDAKAIIESIGTMADGEGFEQQNARDLLRGIGHRIEPLLRQAHKSAKGYGIVRIEFMLETLGVTPIKDEETARVVLATRALEIIGTPAAAKMRMKLIGE